MSINPLLPNGNISSLSAKISILFLRRDHQKNFLWAPRLWVGGRKEPILGYVPITDEKKNSGSKGLNWGTFILCMDDVCSLYLFAYFAPFTKK